MTDEERAKEKYLEFQLLQKQIEQMQGYLDELQSKQLEFLQTKESLHELEKTDQDSECFVSVAQGIFAKAKLNKCDELLVNIGADVAVTKNISQVAELIEKQITEVIGIQGQVEQNIEKLSGRLQMLLDEIQKL
jgi:prefoldin alpha subunit